MRTLEFAEKETLKYFTSPKEMPSGRFQQFQKYLFEMWGVGSTMADVDQRLANAFQLLDAGDKVKGRQELMNLRMTANYIINKLSIDQYAFSILIAEFNGRALTDYSESALSELVKEFKDKIPHITIQEIVDDVKKNLKLD